MKVEQTADTEQSVEKGSTLRRIEQMVRRKSLICLALLGGAAGAYIGDQMSGGSNRNEGFRKLELQQEKNVQLFQANAKFFEEYRLKIARSVKEIDALRQSQLEQE